ncbi:MAG: hypothetical protein ACOX60_01420 [Massiliimalia sp.]
MKRLFYKGDKILQAANLLFGEREDFDVTDYMEYEELEIVLQEDGRFSVWGNYQDDADLLRDTHRDMNGNLAKVAAMADEIIED